MAPEANWKNAGNHWVELQEDVIYGPGKRWKSSIVPYQRKKDEYNDKKENYIYLFGGIRVRNMEELMSLKPADALNATSYIFMSDLWRYELESNQWEEVEVYGISEITRNLYLWNGTRVTMDVETKDRLLEDKNRTKVEQQTTPERDKELGIRLPKIRGGHMMTIIGNPIDYILIFGGTS